MHPRLQTNYFRTRNTTGDPPFAVCQGHTVKPQKPMANRLPCAAHGKAHTATRDRQSRPLPCAIYRAHGKGFAVCNYRPTAKKSCHPGTMTWPGLCCVPCWRGTRQSSNICRVPRFLHTAKIGIFVVCHDFCTRQRCQNQFFFFDYYVYGTPRKSYIS